MKFYLELTIIPSPEIPVHFIWEKLFQELHLAFVECKNSDERTSIGISFPEYKNENGTHSLGAKLRLFSPEFNLKKISELKKLDRLLDYIHITDIRPVPEKVSGYACYRRKQTHSNNDRLAKRRAKRHNVSFQEAQKYFEKRKEDYTDLPFVYLNSHSNQQRFRLLIERIPVEREIKGDFGFYGLSSTATVPEF